MCVRPVQYNARTNGIDRSLLFARIRASHSSRPSVIAGPAPRRLDRLNRHGSHRDGSMVVIEIS